MTTATITSETAVKNPRGDKGRFAGCKTIGDMQARLHKGESIILAHYKYESQIEVRGVRANGRATFPATAELA